MSGAPPRAAVAAGAIRGRHRHCYHHLIRAGYTRQLYDTFFFDEWLPPDATPEDLLGVIDADTLFAAPVLPALYVTNGSLTIVSHARDMYKGNKHLLGVPSTANDVMSVDAMPIVFFVGTLAHLRTVVGGRAGGTFADAWVRVKRLANEAAPGNLNERIISPVNAIASFALAHEPQRYTVSHPGATSRVVPLVGSNRAPKRMVWLGCCRTYGLPACSLTDRNDSSHITEVNNRQENEHWPMERRVAAAATAYERIHAFLDSLPEREVRRRRVACAAFAQSQGV